MTAEMMRVVTKEQLARLHPMTKRELRSYFANQLQIIITNADKIATDTGEVERITAALAIARTARKWHAELEQLFAERSEPAKVSPDRHLGAEEA